MYSMCFAFVYSRWSQGTSSSVSGIIMATVAIPVTHAIAKTTDLNFDSDKIHTAGQENILSQRLYP